MQHAYSSARAQAGARSQLMTAALALEVWVVVPMVLVAVQAAAVQHAYSLAHTQAGAGAQIPIAAVAVQRV